MVVGWMGYGGNSWMADMHRDKLKELGITLKTCHEYANADFPYNYKRVNEFMQSCDVIYLPTRKVQPAKGTNRLAIAWSNKKPVVITEQDSYLDYVIHENNVLIAKTDGIDELIRLKNDRGLAAALAMNGYWTAQKYLNPRSLAEKLILAAKKKFVQVIIPHYQDRKDYLELAILSALKSRGPDRDVLVVSSSKISASYLEEKYKIRVIQTDDRKNFSQANNIGIENASVKTTHFLFLNDDTILTEKALERMVEAIGDKDIVLNPYSNCDYGWLHKDEITVKEKKLHPGMKIENFTTEELENVRNFQRHKSIDLSHTNFCAMYATMIPAHIVEKVGKLDENFKNGGEDADYSYRARALGYESYWTKNAFIFHFGGVSRKFSEDTNYDLHHEEDKYNNALLKNKYSSKKRVAIWTGPAWEKWDLETYKTTGLGGSETCAGRLAETFVKNGNTVEMYGVHDKKTQNGVNLHPWDTLNPEKEKFDLFIASRNINCIDHRLNAKKVVVWTHDIFLLSGKKISQYHLDRVDNFIVLSPWHRNFFIGHHEIPEEYQKKVIIIPNGINTELFE